MELKNFDISSNTGFLPETLLKKLPGDYFTKWEEAVHSLSQWIIDKRVRKEIDALPVKEFSAATLSTKEEWQRAYVLLSFLSQAYLCEIDEGRAKELPKKLAVPWVETSTYIGVPPVATYAAVVLYNYTLKDPRQPFEADNLQAALTFTGSSEESWFYTVHVLEERAAAPGLEAITMAYNAMSHNDNQALAKNLKIIAETLHCMKNTLAKMYDRCSSKFFFNHLRPFLSFPDSGLVYNGVSPNVENFRSGSGAQDSAIPAFSIFLGVNHGDEEQITLDDFKVYMPAKHRAFLNSLCQQPSVSCYVQESGDAELIKSYNETVGALVSFRSQHISLVRSYIIDVKQCQGDKTTEEDKGTGGTPFMSFLKNVKDNTVAQKINL